MVPPQAGCCRWLLRSCEKQQTRAFQQHAKPQRPSFLHLTAAANWPIGGENHTLDSSTCSNRRKQQQTCRCPCGSVRSKPATLCTQGYPCVVSTMDEDWPRASGIQPGSCRCKFRGAVSTPVARLSCEHIERGSAVAYAGLLGCSVRCDPVVASKVGAHLGCEHIRRGPAVGVGGLAGQLHGFQHNPLDLLICALLLLLARLHTAAQASAWQVTSRSSLETALMPSGVRVSDYW